MDIIVKEKIVLVKILANQGKNIVTSIKNTINEKVMLQNRNISLLLYRIFE